VILRLGWRAGRTSLAGSSAAVSTGSLASSGGRTTWGCRSTGAGRNTLAWGASGAAGIGIMSRLSKVTTAARPMAPIAAATPGLRLDFLAEGAR
jgi:hypothetical protein